MGRSLFTRVMIFIVLKYFTGQVSCLDRCIGSRNYCSGQFGDMKAICKAGYCYCTGKDYDYNTCLPDAYGCKIVSNSDSTYTCNPANSSPQYEVHVLAVYEVINRRPPTAGNARVNIISRGKSNRPIVLVLVSYEPVNWVLNIPADIIISKVILVSYYILESSVTGDVSRVKNVERIGTRSSEWSTGYGSDSGGGGTVKTLKQVHKRFGVLTSFRGTYRTTIWSLQVLSPFKGTVNTGTSAATVILTTVSPTVRRKKCLGNYCSGSFEMKAFCREGYCYCRGTGYNYDTCLPDAYGCKIVSNSDSTYTCNPANSSPQYEVHVLAVYEVINRRPPTAGNARVNIISRGKSNRPIVLVLVSYEPVNWVLNIPADIIISKVILVSYYILESSVTGGLSRVKNVERIGTRNSEWSTGYGSDSGGGRTVKTLRQVHKRFGVLTSFRGTYRTNLWSLQVLSPFKGTVNTGCCYDRECGSGLRCCRKEQGESICSESCVGHFCDSNEDCTATGECCVRNECTTSCIGNECKFDNDCGTGEACTHPENNCVYNLTGKPCPERPASKCFSGSGCSAASDCDIFGTGYYCCKLTKYSSKRTCSFDCTNAFCSEDSDCSGPSAGCCDMTNFKCEECSNGFPVWVIGAIVGILAVILIIAGYVRLRLKRRGMHAQSNHPAQTSRTVPQQMQAVPSRGTENEHGNGQVPHLFVRNMNDRNETIVPSAPPLEPYPSTLTWPPPPSYESIFPNR